MSYNYSSNVSYVCQEEDDFCASNCVGLEACSACQCSIAEESDYYESSASGGAWGPVMDVLLCLFPIVFLVVVTLIPKPLPTKVSLPVAAMLMWAVRLMYLNADVILISGSIVAGLHEALTPLTIVAGAITLFETMEATLCLPYMMREMKHLTCGHPVAEAMLLFGFAYLVEGASGFGTPAALGAPMLISLGHKPVESVVTLLMFNTISGVWGATGTPIWFGFGNLVQDGELTQQDLLLISQKAAVALFISSILIIPWVLTVLLPWNIVRRNILFVFGSLAVTVGPSMAIAFFSYEFPSLLGGIIGTMLTAVLIKYSVGLKPLTAEQEQQLGRSVQDISTVVETSIVHAYYMSASAIRSANNNENYIEEEDESDYRDANSQGSADEDYEEIKHNKDKLQVVSSSNTQTVEAALMSSMGNSDDTRDGDIEGAKMATNTSTSSKMVISHNNNGEFMNGSDVNHAAPTAGHNALAATSLSEAIDQKLGPRKEWSEGYLKESLLRTFPIWGTVLLLILTRVEQIGLKELLLKQSPYMEIDLESYGIFRLSVSLVFQLKNILTYPGLNWNYPLLYTPFIIPFVVVSAVTFILFRKNLQSTPRDVARTVGCRLVDPAVALAGALVLVQLMIRSGNSSPAYIIGSNFADWFKGGFVVISPLLGVLGSFFSGSTTLANLTFGGVQLIAAERIGTSVTAMLALQSVGASAGNGICLANIISVCTVVGLHIGEGKIVGLAYKFVFSMTTIATVVMLAFYFRF